MRALPCRFFRPSLVLSVAAVLTACGGGGGDSKTAEVAVQTPQAAVARTPLPLTPANASDTASVTFGYGALALTMGQLAVDWTAQAESGATRSFSTVCPSGGSASGTLADRDGDGRAGAGDQVTVTLTGCYLKPLDETVDGSVTITLAAPAASQQRAGTIAFNGLRGRDGTPREELTGALRFDYSASHLSKLLHVASDTQPFGLRWTDGTATATDTLTALDAQQETRLDTMRATTSMRYSLASELLGGAVTVTTAMPWASWFDTYPDDGALNVVGANGGKMTLKAGYGDGQASIILGGTSLGAISIQGPDGLWSGDAWLPDVAAADHYNVVPLWQSRFRLLRQPDSASFRPSGTLTWLYSRPLDRASIVQAEFVQKEGGYSPWPPVPATVGVEGGLLTITPTTQLKPEATYELRLSTVRGPVLVDTDREQTALPTFTGTVARTVSASIVPAAPPVLLGGAASLALDAGASSANGAPVASTRWRQLSGPVLAFSDAGAARVTVTPAATANGTAVVELQVANAAGEIDSKTIDITVAADVTQSFVMAVREGSAPLAVVTNADPYTYGYARLYQDKNLLDILLGMRRFMVSPREALTWRTGLKLTYSKNGVGSDTAPGWIGCSEATQTGTLSVLEYALDTAGNLDRLALDFDDQCGTTTTLGSIRYHSAVPVRQ